MTTRIASLINPGPVTNPTKNPHRVGASNHHQNGSGENPMVGNGNLGELDELRAEVDELRDARTVLASSVSLLADLLVDLRSERAALWELLKAQTRRLVELREYADRLQADCDLADDFIDDLEQRLRAARGGAR